MLEIYLLTVLPLIICSLILFALVIQLIAGHYTTTKWSEVDEQCDIDDMYNLVKSEYRERDAEEEFIAAIFNHSFGICAIIHTRESSNCPIVGNDRLFDYSDDHRLAA